jgi:hypothetical protein
MKEKDNLDTTPRPQTGRDDESLQSSSCCSGSKATYTDDHQEDYTTSTEPPCSSIWVVCPDGCECKNCEMQSELKLLRENVDNVLNNVYNEINSSEAELARYLDEIRDLEDELEVCLEQEKALLKEIGTATQCLDGKEDQLLDNNPEAAIDEDVKVFQESEREFAIELKLRDEQIAELEKELQDNTNLIKYLSLSLNAGEQAQKYLK